MFTWIAIDMLQPQVFLMGLYRTANNRMSSDLEIWSNIIGRWSTPVTVMWLNQQAAFSVTTHSWNQCRRIHLKKRPSGRKRVACWLGQHQALHIHSNNITRDPWDMALQDFAYTYLMSCITKHLCYHNLFFICNSLHLCNIIDSAIKIIHSCGLLLIILNLLTHLLYSFTTLDYLSPITEIHTRLWPQFCLKSMEVPQAYT